MRCQAWGLTSIYSYLFCSDNTQAQTSHHWVAWLQKYVIGTTTTEANHPHQNPVKRHIQTLKQLTVKIMDCTGTPAKFWLLCLLSSVALVASQRKDTHWVRQFKMTTLTAA